MEMTQRIDALAAWGQVLRQQDLDDWAPVLQQAQDQNPWFTPEQVLFALEQFGEWLQADALAAWAQGHNFPTKPKTVGVVMAGNIPLVGMHDLLSILVSGHRAEAKPSEREEALPKALLQLLAEVSPELAGHISFVERLGATDATIATGSNNSARYFHQYFGDKPHIIRKNRHSAAVLTGQETEADWLGLSEDVFRYYGLGCRSVSHVFLPAGYDPSQLAALLPTPDYVAMSSKYQNNWEYQKATVIVAQHAHIEGDQLVLKEDPALSSPIGVLHYSFYENEKALQHQLQGLSESLQVVVGLGGAPLGSAQRPRLSDYADQVDTLAFLAAL